MRYHYIIFLFSLIVNSSLACQDDCRPLSQIKISQNGAAKLFEIILKNTFESIQNKVESIATFRNFDIDNSKCPKIKLYEVITKKENCIGIIDFRKFKNETPDADAELTGYRAQLNNLNLEKLGMSLHTPVTCKNWNCTFKVKINDIKVSGKVSAKYSDTNKDIFPESSISISSDKEASLFYEVNVRIDPNNGKLGNFETKSVSGNTSLNNLVHVNEGTSKVSISDVGLNYNINLKQRSNSNIDKNLVYKNQYESFKKLLEDDKWILQQYNKLKMNPFNNNRKNAKSNLKPDELIRIIKKANANWKVKDNYLEAFSSMPEEFYSIINASADQKIIAESKYQAEKYGIDDYAAYTTLKNIESLGNKLLRDKEFIGKSLAPFLQSEMGPLIENEVQETLRSSASYWDMVSKVPLGNGEEIQMDTEFIVRELDRIQNLVKMDLYDKNTDCYISNSLGANDEDSNFDMQTNFSTHSLQKIFTQAARERKLNFCSAESANDCKDENIIKIKSPPEIKCNNGKLLLDFKDNEIRPLNLFGAQSSSLVEVDVYNCNGSPCLKLTNLKSEFKSLFMSIPFDRALNKGLNKHFLQQSKTPIQIPNFSLDKVTTDKECNAKFNWMLNP